MLKKTGERQVGNVLDDIRDDHKERYFWAAREIRKSWKVIDAGCGAGYGSNILSSSCEIVYSYDISPEAISYASRFWANPKIDFRVSDIHFLNFNEGAADAIIAFEVIEHIIAPQLFLLAAQRSLRLDGVIFLSVPNERKIPHSVELNPFHLQHYTLEEISSYLKDSGFEILEVLYQDDGVVGSSPGKFILLKAVLKRKSEIPGLMDVVLGETVRKANKLIVERAEFAHRNKKAFENLKVEYERLKSSPSEKISDIKPVLIESSKNIALLLENSRELNTSRNHLFSLERDVEQKNLLITELKTDLKISDLKISTLQEKTFSLEKHNEKLLSDLNSCASKLEKAEDALANGEKIIANKQSEITQLRADLSTSISEKDLIYNQASVFQEKLDKSDAELKIVSSRNLSLLEDLSSSRKEQERLISLEKQSSMKLGILEVEVTNLKNEKAKFEIEGKKFFEEHKKYLEYEKKNTKLLSDMNNSLARAKALSEQNFLLKESLEKLALQLQLAKSSEASQVVMKKEPPSLQYLLKKLRYHRYYIPFLIKAIRNSLGLRKQRKRIHV